MYVDLSNNGKQYTKVLPIGCDIVGAISNNDGSNPSALVYNRLTRLYHRVNGGRLSDIDQNDVALAIANAMSNVTDSIDIPCADLMSKKMRSVTLDDHTVDLLRSYGGGNLSLGIRRAAALIKGV